jgi:ATP-dependent DNA helicase DinG
VGRLRAERNEVLVCPWEFWEANSENIRPPQVMVICSLPFPSLEHPLVHARVSDYKRLRQDWFKEYLLPLALGRLQRGINPLRKTRGLVALLDGRATRRSYGPQFLESLAPARRIVRLADSLPL